MRRSYHQPTTYAQNCWCAATSNTRDSPITRVTNPDGTWTAAAALHGLRQHGRGQLYRDKPQVRHEEHDRRDHRPDQDVLVAKADYSYLFNHSRQNDVISQVTWPQRSGYPDLLSGEQLDAHHRDADRIPQRQRQPSRSPRGCPKTTR